MNYDNQDVDNTIIIVFRPLQVIVIGMLIALTVVANCSIIFHISNSATKANLVNFVLIKHLCFIDLCGGVFILPIPFIATLEGKSLSKELGWYLLTLAGFNVLQQQTVALYNSSQWISSPVIMIRNSGFTISGMNS